MTGSFIEVLTAVKLNQVPAPIPDVLGANVKVKETNYGTIANGSRNYSVSLSESGCFNIANKKGKTKLGG